MHLPLPPMPGDLVVVVLHSPRERLWGCLLRLDPAGVALRGLDLAPWEEVLMLVRTGQEDQIALGTRFLPMHRIEVLYRDEPSSGAPSLAQAFLDRTGLDPAAFLGAFQAPPLTETP